MNNSVVKEFLRYEDTYCLRGIAMLMIIIGHTYNGYPTEDASFYFPSWLHFLYIELWGGMGVAIFLFLSGFGLFTTLCRRETIDKQYIYRKLKRILEPFLIYWIVEIIVLAIINRQELTMHIVKEIATFSIHPNIENWFFKVIAVTYIITIALFRLRMNNSTRIFIISALALLYLVIMKELGFGQWWYNNILCFPIGAIVAHNYSFFEKLSSLMMSIFTFVLMLIIYLVHMNTLVFHLLFVFFSIYAIRIISINHNKLLYFIGYNSFIFYFIECPIEDE